MRRDLRPYLLAPLAIGIAAAVWGQGAATAHAAPASGSAVSGTRVLRVGMRGTDVRALQHRLAAWHYFPGRFDGYFGPYTQEAVWAFQEVQHLTVTGQVGPATFRALDHPRPPRALVPGGGRMRVEISLSRRTLVLYRSGRVALISHVSTGGGYRFCTSNGCVRAITPTGNFRTTEYLPGWINVELGRMFNSVFFIGTKYAIHGEWYVPLRPVSHGCVRIPMDIAAFFHKLVRTPGTPVYIRG
jgi:lipoprotein-anchoring transpeptidase ErfK/SrfK